MTSSMYSFPDVFSSGKTDGGIAIHYIGMSLYSVVTCTEVPAAASEHCNPAQEGESPASRGPRHAPALDQLERG